MQINDPEPITLVVEEFGSDGAIVTSEDYATTEPRSIYNWIDSTKSALQKWNCTPHFNIISVTEFNPDIHKNCFYVVIPRNNVDVFNTDTWTKNIPEQSRKLIKDYPALRVLLAYQFEYFELDTYAAFTFFKTFNQCFPNTKLVMISLTTCVDVTRIYRPVSEINSSLVNIYCCPSVAFLSIVGGPNHQIYELIKSLTIEQYPILREHLFLCLNNRSRLNRTILLQSLYNEELWKHGLISKKQDNLGFNAQNLMQLLNLEHDLIDDPVLHRLSIDTFDNVASKNYAAINNSEKVRLFMSLFNSFNKTGISLCPKQSLQNDRIINNLTDVNNYFNLTWYFTTWCSIVTETYLSHLRPSYPVESPMITEKTVKPLLMMHPFVIIGHGYEHKFLQMLGFKTFEQSWFGLPEDGAIGNKSLFERIFHLTESLKQLSNLTQKQLHSRWIHVTPELIHNRSHFLNTDWCKVQAQLLNDTVNASLPSL